MTSTTSRYRMRLTANLGAGREPVKHAADRRELATGGAVGNWTSLDGFITYILLPVVCEFRQQRVMDSGARPSHLLTQRAKDQRRTAVFRQAVPTRIATRDGIIRQMEPINQSHAR